MLELLQSKWDKMLDYIKDKYNISDDSFDKWLKNLKVHSVKDGVITIVVEESLNVNYINKRFYKYLKVTIVEFFGEKFDILFIYLDDIDNCEVDKKNKSNFSVGDATLRARIEEANLNPRYTFDTFIVGKSNYFAHTYSLKVAEASAEICNPLFLYGGTGLGKTHLMYSIANYILKHNPNAKILYITSETFTNELINVIRNENQNAIMELRNGYRNIDVLLIDDIQIIIKKNRCKEELLHILDILYESKKQIVVSADKTPKEMTILEKQLRVRFYCSLIVEISSPVYETRMAILQKKAELEAYDIDDEILQYIATNILSNIRELEGALTKVVAYSKIYSLKMDVELAKEVLKDSVSN